MTDKIIVLSTCGTEEEARRIAHGLVDAQLAACVNIVPRITSVYRWQGAIEETPECLLVIKTSRALLGEVQRKLEQLHSYELPELLALPVEAGSDRYLAWLDEGLKQQDASSR